MNNSKPLVGLTGGIGAGKTTVAEIFGQLGAVVISSDALAREAINRPEVMEVLGQWWGRSIFDSQHTVDRHRISQIVFSDPAERERLEKLIHPIVAELRAKKIGELARQKDVRAIIIDSPLLYESHLDQVCNAVVFVDTDLEIRKGRSEKGRNWAAGELERREKTQMPLDTKRQRADYICTNNSSLSDLRKQVNQIFADVLANFHED